MRTLAGDVGGDTVLLRKRLCSFDLAIWLENKSMRKQWAVLYYLGLGFSFNNIALIVQISPTTVRYLYKSFAKQLAE